MSKDIYRTGCLIIAISLAVALSGLFRKSGMQITGTPLPQSVTKTGLDVDRPHYPAPKGSLSTPHAP